MFLPIEAALGTEERIYAGKFLWAAVCRVKLVLTAATAVAFEDKNSINFLLTLYITLSAERNRFG